jgi:hypothetical protein
MKMSVIPKNQEDFNLKDKIKTIDANKKFRKISLKGPQ